MLVALSCIRLFYTYCMYCTPIFQSINAIQLTVNPLFHSRPTPSRAHSLQSIAVKPDCSTRLTAKSQRSRAKQLVAMNLASGNALLIE